MKRTLKNSLCLLLSLVLLLSMVPMAVFAEAVVTDPGKILTEAYALASGENLPYTATLTGEITEINTPYNPDFKNVTVTIEVPGYADKPMYCYRIKGEGADALAVGDTITVTGTITNYHGTIEFVAGSALDAVIKSDTVPEPDWTYPTEPIVSEPEYIEPELTTPPAPSGYAEIVDAAYALGENQVMDGTYTLVGIITSVETPYDPGYQNVTVNIVVEGKADKPIKCFRLKGEGADNLANGDTITVTGTLKNYNGIVEFDAGCTLDNVIKGENDAPQAPEDPKQIVDDAYALEGGASLPYTATLTGTITEIVDAYSEQWGNITVKIVIEGREDKPIVCYRMKGTGIETLKPGDVIEVTGTLKNYVKTNQDTGETISTIEFTPATLLAVTAGTGGVPMTVKVIAPYGWTGCYVYSWGPDLFGGWPGQQMTKAADGSYSFTLREEVSGILLSCAGSGTMTEDITDLVYTPGSSATITVEALGGNYKHPYTITYGTGNQGGTSGGNTGGNTGSTGPSGSWPEDGNASMNTLFAWVPASWGSNINAYTWNPEAYNSWPGTPMTPQGEWYRIPLPADAENMIINNGNGNQTYDLELQPNRDVYIVVAESYGHSNAEIYYTPQESLPEVPSYGLYSLAVVGSGLPGIQDWNPADPAGDMTEIRTNVYEKTLTFSQAGDVKIKIAGNDMWDETWNFGIYDYGGEIFFDQVTQMSYGTYAYDMSLTIPEPGTICITVDLNPYLSGGYPTILVEKADGGVAYPTRTLRVQAPESWDTVYAYSWEPESFGYYPGAIMTMSDGWYAATIPGNMENLILSDYANGRKTDALYLEPDEDVWVVIREDCSATVSYSEPAPELPGLDLRVVGNAPWMGGWDCGSTLGKLQEVDNGVYRVTFQNVTPGDYEFKVLKDGRWDGAVGEVGGGNYSFTVTRDCSVTVTFRYERNYIDGTAEVTYAPKYMGDVSGDQRLNVGDVARLYGHIKRTTLLTDEMALLSGDFMADGRINVGDTARIYSYIKASSPAEQVQAAYQLQPGQLIPYTVTLTGTVVSIPEPYNPLTGCITLNIVVDGCESMPLLCSRIRGEDADKILVGSRITVEGTLQNFYGSIEFTQDCRLVKLEGGIVLDETQMAIVDEAYALPQGQKMNRSVTLTGWVESIQRGSYGTTAVILIPGREDKPITCYRLVGTGINQITTGDTVTVTGTLQNFYGSIEFEAGCQLVSGGSGGGVAIQPETDPAAIMAAAGELAENEEMPYDVTLSGKVLSVDEAYTDEYQNVTFTIAVAGAGDQPLKCYRTKGDAAAQVAVNDTVTVTGRIKNHYGTIEMAYGELTARQSGGGSAPVTQTDPKKIVDEAYALQNGASLPYTVTLTGSIVGLKSPYDAQYQNMTVVITVPGREDKPIECYRMKGEGIGNHLCVGDSITVSGKIKNYNGTIEFDAGCLLTDRIPGSASKPTDPRQIVDAAFALGENQSLPYFATLTGVVKSIDEPYTEQYKNVTLTMTVQGTTGPRDIIVYRLKGNDAANVAVGNTITVTGAIKHFVRDTDEGVHEDKVEFDSGCVLNHLMR